MTIAMQSKSGFFLPFLLLSIALISSTVHAQTRDGKLLQGEKWQKFDSAGAKADFFISPAGNDQWSGTLPEANSGKTDGPLQLSNGRKKP